MERAGFADLLAAHGRRHRRAPCREEAHAERARGSPRASPGLGTYLDVLELRLEQAVLSHPGLVSQVGTETLAAGGRPDRFSSSWRRRRISATTSVRSRPGSRSSSCTWRRSSTTISWTQRCSGAAHPAAWATRRAAARAGGDYLFARAFSELARVGDAAAVATLAGGPRARAGEALQRRQTSRPDTSVEDYLLRCSLKTGKLFEAACRLGGSRVDLGAFGLALGVAFQIADDILDCVGTTGATGKAPGVDLRDRTPTLPLILAARETPPSPGRSRVNRFRTRWRASPRRERSKRRAGSPSRSTRRAHGRPSTDTRTARASRPSLAWWLTETTDGDHDSTGSARHDLGEGRGRRAIWTPTTGSRSWSPTTSSSSASWPTRSTPARRHRRRLLRPEPLSEPDERLPREVQVLRVRADGEAGRRVHAHAGRARRRCPRAATAHGLHRDPHGRRREPHVGFDYYEDIVARLHEAMPDVHLKLFTASEIHHMTTLSG